jgi:2'-5' RNA ligase
VGVDEGAERLIQLGAIAEAAARGAGFPAESKEFRPHLTLSRIEPPVSVKTLVSPNTRIGLRMPVDAVVLYRSRLGGGPARYEEVARFELSR